MRILSGRLAVSTLFGAAPAAAQPGGAGSRQRRSPRPSRRSVGHPARSVLQAAAERRRLVVRYRYTPEYDATVAIRPDGFITLPIVGEVKVSGLTVADAAREVRDRRRGAAPRPRDDLRAEGLPEAALRRRRGSGQSGAVRAARPGHGARGDRDGRRLQEQRQAFAMSCSSAAYDETQAVTRVINAKELAKADRIAEDPTSAAGRLPVRPAEQASARSSGSSRSPRSAGCSPASW